MKIPLYLAAITLWLSVVAASAQGSSRTPPAEPRSSSALNLELKPGDHIALIGNALADRFQHSGWLETLIYSKYPEGNLVFRNLAAAGDEVVTWHRPEDFGSRDEWLKKTKADVIFAFYGFNESFKGAAGLPKFRSDLDTFLKETQAKNYSGRANARVVLFSPIANESASTLISAQDLFDANRNNANIREYAQAMAEVARNNNVPFVDLFDISQQLYKDSEARHEPLTINGLHLTDKGDALVASMIMVQLFGEQPVEGASSLLARASSGSLEKLRAAVNEKNEQWHARYRTIDGYNVYGGRSALAYKPDKGGFI